MRFHVCLCLALFMVQTIYAQELPPSMEISFDLGVNFKFHNLLEAPDGRLFAVGETSEDSDPNSALLIFDVESERGEPVKFILDKGAFYDHVLLPNGNFLLTGIHREANKGWFYEVDEQGQKVNEWFVDNTNSGIYEAELLYRDTVVVAGYTNSRTNGRIWVGAWAGKKLIWQREFKNSDIESSLSKSLGKVQSLVVTHAGNIAITGIFNDGEQGFWTAILDKEGDVLQAKSFSGKATPTQILEDKDGSFLIMGTIYTDFKRGDDGWLARLSPNLQKMDELWRSDQPNSAQVLSAGLTLARDVVLAGETYENSKSGQQQQGLIAFYGKDSTTRFGKIKLNAKWDQALLAYDGSVYFIGSEVKRKGTDEVWLTKYSVPFPETADGAKGLSEARKNPFIITVNFLDFDKGRAMEPGANAWVEVTVKNIGDKSHFPCLVYLEPSSAIIPKYDRGYNLGRLSPGDVITKPISFTVGKNVSNAKADIKLSVSIEGVTPIVLPTQQITIRTSHSSNRIVESTKGTRSKSDRSPDYRVEWILTSPEEFYASNIILLHNGKEVVLTAKDEQVSFQRRDVRDGYGNFEADFAYTFTLQKGKNVFEIQLKNEQGVTLAQYQARPVEYDDTRKPNLHLICIGPKYKEGDIKYTSKDAEEVAKVFASQYGENEIFKSVNPTLVDPFSSGVNIELEFDQLLDRYHQRDGIYPGDLILLFNSSHGKIIDGKYYIFPYGYKTDKKNTLVDYQAAILEPLRQIADSCKVITLIDACFSGGAKSGEEEGAALKAILDDWERSAPGITSIASSGEKEKSYESEKNGIFTKALLEALRNEVVRDEKGQPYHADVDSDRYLSLQEVFSYIEKRVEQLAKQEKGEVQRPVITWGQLDAEKIRIYHIKN